MTAVAVWTSLPDSAALLEARLQRGWQPRPSQMTGGDQILGYAACLVKFPK